MRIKAISLAGLAASLAFAAPAAAETYTVTGLTDLAGTCAGTQCASIRQALATAGSNPGADTIAIPAGDYQLTQGRLDVDSDVTIVGAGARATIIRGYEQFPDNVFFVNGVASATISHLTMRDGSGGNGGGNLRNAGTVVLDHVRVTAGFASGSGGGGVLNASGTMTIRHSLIDGNGAYEGGGILNFGVDGPPARLTVIDTTIAGNSAVRAGGLSTYGNDSNTVTLDRVTLVHNEATDGTPAGMLIDQDDGGVVRVRGSILAANDEFGEDVNCSGAPPISEGGNVSSTTDCGLTGPGDLQGVNAQVSVAPETAGETDTYPLAPGSPAIDRFACTGSDQRDITRPQGSACDAGAYEVDQLPDTVLGEGPGGYTFSSPEPGVTFECAIEGVSGFVPCTSPYSPTGLAPGTYTLLVRAVDAAGQRDPSPAARTFTVASPPPTATPTPAPTPAPAPVFNQTVVVRPVRGTVRVRRPGSSKFVKLAEGAGIPIGSTVDTKKGKIELTSIVTRGGRPQTAAFFDGIFKIGQSQGYTELQLTEKLAACPRRGRAAAAAAAKKPKTRKLWGDGKGRFRTKGSYSAATVRGTKWLVQDSCAGTLTRVTRGSVNVRDTVRRKTIVVRANGRYLAKPKR